MPQMKRPGGDASSTEAGPPGRSARRRRLVYRGGAPGPIADSASRRDATLHPRLAYWRLVDSKIDAAPPPIAAPINAPFLPPMMAPTPAPDAADPPMTMAVFFQVRCGGASSTTTASRWTGAALRTAVRRGAVAVRTTGRELTN